MAIGLLGRKVGMTQIFDEAGAVSGDGHPGRALPRAAAPHAWTATATKPSRSAISINPAAWPAAAERGHVAKLDSRRSPLRAKAGLEPLDKADCEPKRSFASFAAPAEGVTVGQQLTVELFDEIEAVDVTGTTKGRGTAGVMVRHNFKGQRARTA